MPKMKTKSAAKKRFRVTASGKVKRQHSGKNHILTKKAQEKERFKTGCVRRQHAGKDDQDLDLQQIRNGG